MSITIHSSRTYRGALIIQTSQLESARKAQSAAYDAIYQKMNQSKIQSLFNDSLAVAGLSALSVGVSGSGIALALATIVNQLSQVEANGRANVLWGGHRVLEKLKTDYENKSNYRAIEVEFAFIEDTLSNGNKVRFIYGNGTGDVTQSFIVKRIQTTSGNWITN